MSELGDRKLFIPDTNSFIRNRDSIEVLGDEGNTVLITAPVFDELDHLKDSRNGARAAARAVINSILEYQSRSDDPTQMPLPRGGTLVLEMPTATLRKKAQKTPVDDMLIQRAVQEADKIRKARNGGQFDEVVLITADNPLTVKARAHKVKVQPPRMKPKRSSVTDEYYSGRLTLVIDGEWWESIATDCHRERKLKAGDVLQYVKGEVPPRLYPNQCVTFREEGSAREFWTIYKEHANTLRIIDLNRRSRSTDIEPRGAEQAYAYALLTDPDIDVITLAGPAGTGKTMLALLAGWDQMPDLYGKLIVCRPAVEVGGGIGNKTHGFMPGRMQQKIEVWHRPIMDNMALILAHTHRGAMAQFLSKADTKINDVRDLINSQKLEMTAIEYLRGASLHDMVLICDEAQNTRTEEVKTILTRAAGKTKVILTGDPDQSDRPRNGRQSNGLLHTMERMRGWEHYAHLTLTEVSVQRSRLCAEAVKRM